MRSAVQILQLAACVHPVPYVSGICASVFLSAAELHPVFGHRLDVVRL